MLLRWRFLYLLPQVWVIVLISKKYSSTVLECTSSTVYSNGRQIQSLIIPIRIKRIDCLVVLDSPVKCFYVMCIELVLLSSPILYYCLCLFMCSVTVYVFKTGAIELSVLFHLYYLFSLLTCTCTRGLKYLKMSTAHREGRRRGQRQRARHGGTKRRSAEGVWACEVWRGAPSKCDENASLPLI